MFVFKIPLKQHFMLNCRIFRNKTPKAAATSQTKQPLLHIIIYHIYTEISPENAAEYYHHTNQNDNIHRIRADDYPQKFQSNNCQKQLLFQPHTPMSGIEHHSTALLLINHTRLSIYAEISILSPHIFSKILSEIPKSILVAIVFKNLTKLTLASFSALSEIALTIAQGI